MTPRRFWLVLAAFLLLTRAAHVRILWPEETLPIAVAAQVLHGKALYSEAWFDKPPLVTLVYTLWGARDGWPDRIAGTVYALIVCWLAWRFARDLWGGREAYWAASLTAFFLTFEFHSAVMALAADLLLVAPHLAAVWLAFRGRAFSSGMMAGLALLVNLKAVFALAACLFWVGRGIPAFAAGAAVPLAAMGAYLGVRGALPAMFDQVWVWSRLYAADTFVAEPVRQGLIRTASWAGFHAALLAPAIWALRGEPRRLRWIAWAALSLVAAFVGLRFFPRYFFQLLPVAVLLAARGCARSRVAAWACVALLTIPAARFGPRYAMLGADLAAGREHQWRDLALDRDSRDAAALVRALAKPGDTLQVWGFRSELYIYTGLPAATRYLDSQPFTGVPADRHLTQSRPVDAPFPGANRAYLATQRPDFVLDGLGPLNPELAIERYPDLAAWFANYRLAGQTATVRIYRRVSPSS